MLERFRAFWNKVFSPVADGLITIGVTPNMVTWVGTIGVCVGALWLFPQGEFFWGTMFVTAFVFSDIIDGTMARKLGRSSKYGAFLDSTLDRMGDAAVFGGIALWYAWDGDSKLYLCLALACLVLGSLTSYARARAESLGMEAKGGIAERSDRLVAILVMTGLSGLFDLPILQHIALWALAVASLVTVAQRMAMVKRQADAA
ncbi:phosphatidylinositol phosphate synthase [Aeromicrobium duanguangcaii]|uniref:Phosphatidylinositol phosphate synthase n=1 Tax=Aeromicrobium duanguangcaii TaxID=2968086 RepID=A0ABY5KIK3_9ACTN|nr:CDP-alcohol phosphatidyltransferase family protein [Aeromicrobium duanguangcaii]MCD9153091.1 CDP-alcohol phosphatidyltransferase family protein [Aeromicrobium duanguangcaii]MCL3836913.1 CDP-alcohol phosphatidyltransferase family protein [Aeromicrobium duanguangcaii]UUI69808.1 CDP-alcohol phosphatidyltransferase family protein [Aeromicrobium duanguangcaii]